jgi:hypothetical protein
MRFCCCLVLEIILDCVVPELLFCVLCVGLTAGSVLLLFAFYICIHGMVRHWGVYGMKYIEMKFFTKVRGNK